MLQPAAIPVDGMMGRLLDFLFGPSAGASRDEVLMMYEMLATFGLMILFFFDVVGAVLDSSLGKLLLMFNSMIMVFFAGLVADLPALEPCNPNPESPKIAFALFWMMVGRLAYLWPVFIIHSTKGETNGNWMSIFEMGSVIFTSCSSIFLFRAWKRLRETCPIDHPARDWDIQYGIFMPKFQGDDEDIELEGIPAENNHLARKYGATSNAAGYTELA
mmetsp:Transcript_35679/g.77880  ORF Transcript_35679/g.77880 Transcript_35679/m.77880 type:complete len:217 (-) Transcript_35679:158-808(-)|eukprot:CAMPEP_0118933614 /NCGR_PEP_ID=MMETSP1169-20130426/12090_1 /TAXON_ID=36882 /ORGANISM="Pyramimonas obovata, Strain CCMP722" /LENGTH=216 /DNA_ID=CAMNT_0006876397 /DNA_START=229 /DNA_END=879 /DNA_ORIENTATION=-